MSPASRGEQDGVLLIPESSNHTVDHASVSPEGVRGESDPTATSTDAGGGSSLILRLPDFLLHKILEALLDGSTPAQACRLGTTCRGLRRVVASHAQLWTRLADDLGWRRSATVVCSERAPGIDDSVIYSDGGEVSGGRSIGEAPCFEYYCRRMQIRWRIRGLLKRYTQFIPRESCLAMRKGATVEDLEAAEECLGIRLPCQLWESLRFRDGQLDAQRVTFVDGARLLSIGEMVQELRDVVAAYRLDCGRVMGQRVNGKAAVYCGGGPSGDELLLPLSTAMSGGRRVACSAVTGAIYFTSGFTNIRKADCWVDFLLALLR